MAIPLSQEYTNLLEPLRQLTMTQTIPEALKQLAPGLSKRGISGSGVSAQIESDMVAKILQSL